MGMSSWFKKMGFAADLADIGFERVNDASDVGGLIEVSQGEPIFIYKHSPICSVSTFSYRQVARFLESHDERPRFYWVDVLASRPASQEIASRLEVVHQSPQLILVRNGEAVWHVSHGEIEEDAIERALKSLEN